MVEQQQTQTLLIVDDNQSNAQSLANILQDYVLSFAKTAKQALAIVQSQSFDLILIDMEVPKQEDFEVCMQLHQLSETKAIPVVFLAEQSNVDDIVKGLEAGAMDYVLKPFNVLELLARVKNQLKLKSNQDALTRTNHEQKELLHVLCHDLVNILGGVFSISEVLDCDHVDKYRDMLLFSASHGLQVIELVRQMRVLQEYPLTLHAVNLAQAINDSRSLLQDKLKAKMINLGIHCASDISVMADYTSLVNSVLNNLLTNAIKFSYEKSTITVQVTIKDAKAILVIQDSGIGMPEKLIEGLFEMGKSCSRIGTAGERGTGFGMPLVKKFVLAYGGEISVFSKDKKVYPEEHGTAITVILPLASPPVS